MDLFEELELMAQNAILHPIPEAEELEATAERWMALFSFSYADAIITIEKHRKNISRVRVSDDLWGVVREEREALGYDRESYEYSLSLQSTGMRSKLDTSTSTTQQSKQKIDLRARYLVKLTEKLTPALIQTMGGSDAIPEVVRGQGDGEDGEGQEAQFIIIDSLTKNLLTSHPQWPVWNSTLVRIPSPAAKDLSQHSAYPTLGIDTTLPQHRPATISASFLPAQDRYPVWYFFYGTLANAEKLSSLFSVPLSSLSELVPAKTKRGKIKTWAGKYRALVDGKESDEVAGSAYEVTSKEQENALRAYETDNYEVVRCEIEMGGEIVNGCTFRFVRVD